MFHFQPANKLGIFFSKNRTLQFSVLLLFMMILHCKTICVRKKVIFIIFIFLKNVANNNNLTLNEYGRLSIGSSTPSMQHSRYLQPRRILPPRQSSLPAAPHSATNTCQMHSNLQHLPAAPASSLRHLSSSCLSSANSSRLLLHSSR